MAKSEVAFPEEFVWGASASAYQIEGASSADGKGQSIWDEFCKRSGAVWRGHTGDTACDHYHRYREDVALMRDVGLGAYRLSVSWPRVLPDGIGATNEAGLDFYDRLIDELLAAKIEPYVTLYHWELPWPLYERGGWLDRDCAAWFGEYAATVAARLSDRVHCWITLNEPQAFIHSGFLEGDHAPGERREMSDVLQVGHHALLAHGKAVRAIRESSNGPCRIGYAPVGVANVPATSSQADIEAARRAMVAVDPKHLWNNAWWLDPVFFGMYPDEGLAAYGPHVPRVRSGDMEEIAQPIDFLGANIYTAGVVSAGADGRPVPVTPSPQSTVTPMDWDVVPESLEWGPRFLWERYKVPIVITENGMAAREWVCLDGAVHDLMRIDFMRRHLLALRRVVHSGVPVEGYFHWSIMDNFEWARGYRERFGLIHVNFETQERTLKDSAHWYRQVITSRGASLDNDDLAIHPA